MPKTVTVRITDLARAVTAFEAFMDGPGQDEDDNTVYMENRAALDRLYEAIKCPACKHQLAPDGDCDACGWTDAFDQE